MIRIVTDTAADLPAEIVAAHGITVVPLSVRFGEDVLRSDVTPSEFWRRLAAADRLPETAPATTGAFVDTFRRLTDEGADGIVTVSLSSAVSATYESAVLAAERVADEVAVRVVDSQSVSMALGLQVTAAAATAAAGGSLDEVALTATDAASKTNFFAAVDTLTYLRRGGSVGPVSAALGRLLGIKPLFQFVDGAIAPAGRARTRAGAIGAIVDKAFDLADRLDALSVVHGHADDVEELLDRLRSVLPDTNPIVAELGPVVGTHAGPGAIGIAYRLT